MYDFYYFNGDSYSAPNGWVESFAQIKNIRYLNDAIPGCSNNRIFRSSIERLLKLKNEHKKIMIIIGVTFVSRDEIWNFETNSLVTLDKVLKDKNVSDELKLKLHFQDINHQLVHFYTNLYMFVNLLNYWDIDYFIFSAANNSDFGTLNWDYLKTLSMYNAITNDHRIYKLHDFWVQKCAEENSIRVKSTGHLMDKTGYDFFAKEIDKKIQDLVE